MNSNVKSCARCGKDHQNVTFRPLAKPMAPDNAGGRVWSHYATCPTTGEPIMMSISNVGVPAGSARGDERLDGPQSGGEVGHE